MARTSTTVDPKVSKKLDEAYQGKYGRSPSELQKALDEQFKPADSDEKSIISERTISKFFNADVRDRKMNGTSLNYLCQHLLEVDSYVEAQEKIEEDIDHVDSIKPPTIEEDKLQQRLLQYQNYIRDRCGFVRIPDMREKRDLDAVYVSAKLQKDLPSRTPKSLANLESEMDNCSQSNPQVWDVQEIFSHYPQLMIWGAAGSGKTTLLKNWISNIEVSATEIPIFISILDYMKMLNTKPKEMSLTDAISYELSLGGFKDLEITEWVKEKLNEGCCLIALDGLDEIPIDRINEIYDNLEQLVREFPKNQYAITCRVGAAENPPESFAEFEVAKWTDEQIDKFIHKWFTNSKHAESIQLFQQELEERPFAKDFAVNPLLLTLLCQLYEAGYTMPQNQANILEDAVDFYLRRWDEFRRINRDPIYDNKLTRQRRRDFFTKISTSAMAKGKKFWERWELEDEIKCFIKNIPEVTETSLEPDSRKVLYAIEAQHGLLARVAKDCFAFSHLSFQEYFVFQDMLETLGQNPEQIHNFLDQHVLDSNYRNPIILLAERQKDAEPLLKDLSDRLVEIVQNNERVQKNFEWLDKITWDADVGTPAWRACVFVHDLETPAFSTDDWEAQQRANAQKIAANLRQFNKRFGQITMPTIRIKLILRLVTIDRLILDRSQGKLKELEQVYKFDPDYETYQQHLKEKFTEAIEWLPKAGFPELKQPFETFSKHFPVSDAPPEGWNAWLTDFQPLVREHLDICHSHPVTEENIKAFKEYIYIAQILSEMLLRDIYCDRQVKQEIVQQLFLPSYPKHN